MDGKEAQELGKDTNRREEDGSGGTGGLMVYSVGIGGGGGV